jgi:hypothetical protein
VARKLTNDREIDGFISKVIHEANHHAPSVNAIIKPLSDAVRARLVLGSDTVSVYERNNQLARTCWVVLNGKRYAFSYNYDDLVIDLRERSTQGQVLHKFSNRTSLSTINRVVGQL